MAIRLGYDKCGADLEAFVGNTGNHSAAAGRPGWRGQRLRPAAACRVAQSARLPRRVLPGPAFRSSASPGAAAVPAMAPRRRASPGVAVACCWLLTGERPCFSLSISCARGSGLSVGRELGGAVAQGDGGSPDPLLGAPGRLGRLEYRKEFVRFRFDRN